MSTGAAGVYLGYYYFECDDINFRLDLFNPEKVREFLRNTPHHEKCDCEQEALFYLTRWNWDLTEKSIHAIRTKRRMCWMYKRNAIIRNYIDHIRKKIRSTNDKIYMNRLFNELTQYNTVIKQYRYIYFIIPEELLIDLKKIIFKMFRYYFENIILFLYNIIWKRKQPKLSVELPPEIKYIILSFIPYGKVSKLSVYIPFESTVTSKK